MERNEVKNPHRMQAIAWRNGTEKEEVVRILNSPVIDCLIPENMKTYQGKNNAGKRVLWACRQLKMLAEMGRLNMESSSFGKAADVETLEAQVADLEVKLKQAQGGEVSYVDTISRQIALIRFFRNIMECNGCNKSMKSIFVIRQENLKFGMCPIL